LEYSFQHPHGHMNTHQQQTINLVWKNSNLKIRKTLKFKENIWTTILFESGKIFVRLLWGPQGVSNILIGTVVCTLPVTWDINNFFYRVTVSIDLLNVGTYHIGTVGTLTKQVLDENW